MAVETLLLVEMRLTDYTDPDNPVIQPIRFCNAPFDVTEAAGNVVYTAAGDLIGIGDYENTYELITDGLELRLSGVDPTYQAIINMKGFDNAPIDIWTAQLVPDTNSVTTKVYYHRGFAGTPVTEHDESSGTITIAMQTRSAFKSLDRSARLMTTSMAHHQALTADPTGTRPNDKFYQYSSDIGFGEETWRR